MTFRTSHWLGTLFLLVVAGVVHGMWTQRWSSKSAAASVDLLAQIEQPLGDWSVGAVVPVNEKDIPKGTAVSCRQFTNAKANQRVVVSVTSGVPGIVAAHTPDVCFLGSGYKLKAPPTKQVISLAGGGNVAYYVADFEKSTATGVEAVRCRWTWSADGVWHAPDYPRLFFAKAQAAMPILYKLYVVHQLGDEDLTKNDPYRTFAAELAGVLGRKLAQ